MSRAKRLKRVKRAKRRMFKKYSGVHKKNYVLGKRGGIRL